MSGTVGYVAWLRDRVGAQAVQLNFAAACVLSDGCVLLQRRGDDDSWGFPGGCIELGESAEEAVIREVAEETALQIEVTGLLGVYTKYHHVYPNGDQAQTLTVFFLAVPLPGVPRPDGVESVEAVFVPLADVPVLGNQQHNDALDDLRAGRTAVFR